MDLRFFFFLFLLYKKTMAILTEEEKLLQGNKYFNIARKVSFDA